MKTYISLLRGINVTGHNIIKMEVLRKIYENLGHHNVESYVQSGNVVFQSECNHEKEIAENIAQKIKEVFGFDVPVIVLSVEKLERIIRNNPFLKDAETDEAFFHITFLSEKPKSFSVEIIEQKKQPNEHIAFADDAVYLYCPNGYGKTKLHNTFLESKLKVAATTRNWRTTRKLLEMAEKYGQ